MGFFFLFFGCKRVRRSGFSFKEAKKPRSNRVAHPREELDQSLSSGSWLPVIKEVRLAPEIKDPGQCKRQIYITPVLDNTGSSQRLGIPWSVFLLFCSFFFPAEPFPVGLFKCKYQPPIYIEIS